jgi:hypothetical protein
MKHALDRLWLLIISSQLQTTYSSVSPGRLASAQQTADLLHLIKVWLCGCRRRTRLARPMQQGAAGPAVVLARSPTPPTRPPVSTARAVVRGWWLSSSASPRRSVSFCRRRRVASIIPVRTYGLDPIARPPCIFLLSRCLHRVRTRT